MYYYCTTTTSRVNYSRLTPDAIEIAQVRKKKQPLGLLRFRHPRSFAIQKIPTLPSMWSNVDAHQPTDREVNSRSGWVDLSGGALP